MSRADEYRRLAREYFATASTVMTQQTRAALIEMAQLYTRRANELEQQAAGTQQQQQQQQTDKEGGDKE
jgi:hypothetical protein